MTTKLRIINSVLFTASILMFPLDLFVVVVLPIVGAIQQLQWLLVRAEIAYGTLVRKSVMTRVNLKETPNHD